MKKTCIFFIGFLMSSLAYCQQDAQLSQYMFNQQFFNPASVGKDSTKMNIGLLYRNQWTGYQASFDDGGAPQTMLGYFNMPIKVGLFHAGAGVHFVSDRIGPVTNTEVMASVAYHLPIPHGNISLGVRGGIYNQSIDYALYRPNDPNDPLLVNQGNQNQFKSDFAIGLHANYKKVFLGIGFNHLGKSAFDYGTDIVRTTLDNHVNVMAGGAWQVSNSWALQPSVMLKSDFNTLSYEASLINWLNDRYYAGFSVRNSNAVDDLVFLIGTNLLADKSLRLGYALDYVLSGQQSKSGSSHEVMLAYQLPSKQKQFLPIIRTPRFRH